MGRAKRFFAAVFVSLFAVSFSFADVFLDELAALFMDIGINLAHDILVDDTLGDFSDLTDLFDDDWCYDEDGEFKFHREKSNRLYKDGKQAEKEKRYVHALSYYYDAYKYNYDNKKADRAYMRLSKKIIYEKVRKEDLEKSLKEYFEEHPYSEETMTRKMREILGTVMFGLGVMDFSCHFSETVLYCMQ